MFGIRRTRRFVHALPGSGDEQPGKIMADKGRATHHAVHRGVAFMDLVGRAREFAVMRDAVQRGLILCRCRNAGEPVEQRRASLVRQIPK